MRFDVHRSKLGLPACDSKEEAHLLTISIQPGGEPHGIGHNLANKSRYNRIKGSLTGGIISNLLGSLLSKCRFQTLAKFKETRWQIISRRLLLVIPAAVDMAKSKSPVSAKTSATNRWARAFSWGLSTWDSSRLGAPHLRLSI
jgi:hypothetical protein